MNPRAHFCVREICVYTNNAVPIKYITKKYHRQIFFTPKKPLIVRLRNRDVAPGTVCPGAHFCVRKICIYTNNAVLIKYLPKTQIQFAHPYSQYNISKISPTIFPLGGDTPFCAFGYEIKDFYLTQKTPVDNSPPAPFKTNSYFVFFSVFVSAFFSVLASFASLASFSITAFSSL